MGPNVSWQHQMKHQEAAVTNCYFTGSDFKKLFSDRVVQHKKTLGRDRGISRVQALEHLVRHSHSWSRLSSSPGFEQEADPDDPQYSVCDLRFD